MKRSELENIIAEEITAMLTDLMEIAVVKGARKKPSYAKKLSRKGKKAVAGPQRDASSWDSAGTVPKVHNRKMTDGQISAREKIGKKIINTLRRGNKANNKLYKALERHGRKKEILGRTPTRKEIFSLAWAMATDYAIKGKDFKTGSGTKTKKSKGDSK